MLATKENIIFTVIIITVTYFILTGFIILIIYNYFKSRKEKEKEILKAVFFTEEKERERMLEDLHDDIGAKLSTLKIQNELIIKDAVSESIKEYSSKNAKLIDRIVKDIRVIVRNQASKYIIDNGLEHELNEFKRQYIPSTIQTNLQLNLKKLILKNDFQVNLFRILQELMHNSVKHSFCSEISIRMEIINNELKIIYSDNGNGFEKETISSGMGMKNIDARIKLFDGKYDFKSIPGHKTSFTIIYKTEEIFLQNKKK